MELGNILNPLAYKKKYRRDRDHDQDRLRTIHAHGLARDLRKWWQAHFMFFEPEAGRLENGELIFNALFSQQINALIHYKKAAESRNIHSEALECTAEVLESLIQKYFPHALTLHGPSSKGFEWDGAKYVVQARRGLAASYMGPCKHPSSVKTAWVYNKLKIGTSSPLGPLQSTRSL
jgi:hypothetical protein